MSDANIRTQALDPRYSYIVQAPAGSGKTELLIQRYLVLLARVRSPENIIAITFTRKAQAEMRQRILVALEFAKNNPMPEPDYQKTTWQLAKAVLEQAKKQNWQLMQNPHRLRILTIDALAGSLTQQMPVLARSGAQPIVREDCQAIYQQAVEQFFYTLADNSTWQPMLEKLMLHLNNNQQSAQRLFINMLAKRDQWLAEVLAAKNTKQLKTVLENSLANIVQEALAKLCCPVGFQSEIIELLRFAANNLAAQKPEHPLVAAQDLEEFPNGSIENVIYWQAISQFLLTKEGQWRKPGGINKTLGFPASGDGEDQAEKQLYKDYKIRMQSLLEEMNGNEDFKISLWQITNCPPLHYLPKQWDILAALLTLLPLLVAQLNLLFQQTGMMDFIEINLCAQRALGSDGEPTDLAMHLDYQIEHLLVDEFQDTSVTHFRLIEQLISAWQPEDGRTLFLVGDPMQSIYRFRHAEVGLFLQVCAEGIGQITPLPLTLTRNFRSDAKLVGWVNDTFSTLFPQTADIAAGAVPFTSAQAVTQNTHAADSYSHVLLNADNNDQVAEMLSVIRQLQQDHPQYSIAVLVRARTHLLHLLKTLREEKIAFQAVEIEALANASVIQDLLALTSALWHMGDRIAWLSILRAPWCGLCLADLHVITQQAKDAAIFPTICDINALSLSADGKQRLQKMLPILQQALLNRGRKSIARWVEGVWLALGGPGCLSDAKQLDNADVFFTLLNQLEERELCFSIDQLKDEIAALKASTQTQQACSLQIMTIHKAKGLEFDAVILPSLERKMKANNKELLMYLERPSQQGGSDLVLAPIKMRQKDPDRIYSYLRQLENTKMQYETARLLYVATTRAKHQLHLMINVQANNQGATLRLPAKGSFLDLLWPQYQQKLQQKISINDTNQDDKAAVIVEPKLQRLPLAWQLPTCDESILIQQAPINLAINDDIKAELFNDAPQIIGSVIHQALYRLSLKPLTHWQAKTLAEEENYWQRQLQAYDLDPQAQQSARQTVRQAVQNILADERGCWLLHPHAQAQSEYPLTGHVQDKWVHVILDRTFIDADGVRWIVDYKTSSPQGISKQLFLSQEKQSYSNQLQNYAKVLQLLDECPIRLGLYFVLTGDWLSWSMTERAIME